MVSMTKTASDVLVETIMDWGVDTVFGIPGDGINGTIEALRKHRDQVRCIQVRHEEAAAFAACGYAKFTPMDVRPASVMAQETGSKCDRLRIHSTGRRSGLRTPRPLPLL
jgi:glyoxylate carboligase